MLYRVLGSVAVALAALGAFLPLLPTTPFLLVAAWAFARSSPKLHQALLAHPRFGPLLRDWETHRAIPRRAKILAVVGMSVSWILVLVASRHWGAPLLAGAVMLASGAYVISRPEPPKPDSETVRR